MKKRFIAITALLFTFGLSVQQIISNPTGAPAQASGGPAEAGATCTQSGCHFGAPAAVTDIITTDIPAAGYTPGATYNITVTVAGSGWKGFMVSAQNETGTYLGTMIAGTGSKVVFTNYVTHSSDKSTASAVWTFKWKAPAAGAGAASFYGSFAVTRNTTRTQKVTVQENTTTGVDEVQNGVAFNAYPNPVMDQLNLTLDLPQSERTTITMVSIDGKQSNVLFDGIRQSGKQEASFDVSDMSNGLYLVQITTPTTSSYRKVLINK